MSHGKIFDPDPLLQDFRNEEQRARQAPGDRRDGRFYDYPESLVTAINVALATGRPLVLKGQAGCGKSSVAYNVARVMKRCYYEKVISTRMEARDLLWRFDAVRRLGDAQVQGAARVEGQRADQWRSYYPYIEPEILWWVFDPASARRRGLPPARELFFEEARDPVLFRPSEENSASRSVVLLDEIDKAEPDVPNNLLVAFGSLQFQVEHIQRTVEFQGGRMAELAAEDLPLILITTNEERQLPPAFLRRCIVYRFEPADDDRLVKIAAISEGTAELGIYRTIAQTMRRLAAKEAKDSGRQAAVSIAEYLDAVRACVRLGPEENSKEMVEIVQWATWKQPARD